jgi:predicted SnoaL-like aldol condensation-catalyzing enzyme
MTTPQDNKTHVVEALDALFNRRDYEKAAALWSPDYIQHSRFVPPGRDGLFGLVRSLPEDARYQPGLAMADGDHVMIHGRYAVPGRPALISVDIFRLENGILVEHWDVLQEEATADRVHGSGVADG